ncbi:MAG: SpoIIE family protein phosphatase [Bacteroidia bacterium]|nr:SpoIIE family protein phosphatase [Bacteroidia bacterium]
MISILVSIIIVIVAVSVCLFMFQYKKTSGEKELLREQKETALKELNELKGIVPAQLEEKEKTEAEKKKAEEKNKKLWAMSEAVYKEKAKVDEANELLKQDKETLTKEKEKLEVDKKKVDEKVKKLWSQSVAIHKEKERINELKLEIEQKHKEIIDSVNYAKRIQEAILPDKDLIFSHLPHSFILFKPRDIVSGDFYWFSHKNGISIIAAVDCTGHGVPGAFMSMIGNTLLNEIVNEKGHTDPGQILFYLNEEVNFALKQGRQDSESRDGMDVALCCFDYGKMEMSYAGANRPLYFIKGNELLETKASKFPIGGAVYDTPKKFVTTTFPIAAFESFYIATDGFADQFGMNEKKLMTKNFKEQLILIQEKRMSEQRAHLNDFIDNWKGTTEQTDDILVIGVRV